MRQRTGASDVISDIIVQLSTETNDSREMLPTTTTATFISNTIRTDVTHNHQQQKQKTNRQSSAAVKRRMDSLSSSSSSSLSSVITRKRPRYEYNERQRRLLCDAFAKSK